jgi:hypothetical protein
MILFLTRKYQFKNKIFTPKYLDNWMRKMHKFFIYYNFILFEIKLKKIYVNDNYGIKE